MPSVSPPRNVADSNIFVGELHAEVSFEHVECDRRGRLSAEAAVLDEHAHGEVGLLLEVSRPVAAPPGLVEETLHHAF